MGNKFFMGVAALAAAGSVFGADRLSATEKGSLLMFVNANGTIHISNDYPADVQLQAYVTAGCGASYDMGFSLTANQIAAFDSYDLAMPLGASDCSMYVWAVNNDNAQIRWNHLSGGIIGGGAYASAAAMQGSNGDTVGVAGTINMDGGAATALVKGPDDMMPGSRGDIATIAWIGAAFNFASARVKLVLDEAIVEA